MTKSFVVPHLSGRFHSLIHRIKVLDGETRIVMECTGHYYEPVARDFILFTGCYIFAYKKFVESLIF